MEICSWRLNMQADFCSVVQINLITVRRQLSFCCLVNPPVTFLSLLSFIILPSASAWNRSRGSDAENQQTEPTRSHRGQKSYLVQLALKHLAAALMLWSGFSSFGKSEGVSILAWRAVVITSASTVDLQRQTVRREELDQYIARNGLTLVHLH